ncbi:hypothetical protein [Paenibacillus sp. NPDC058071]|uniref:hypothetical protein n=1 Tax=Paenibacillus sp. NPDC058071 TaxID=3346326 RepID=UPI0036DE9146
MTEITMNLMKDWNDTVIEVFRGSGTPLPQLMTDEEIGIAYYRQTSETEEEAKEKQVANLERLSDIERAIREHFETFIMPDIRSRTGYKGDRFLFRWVFNQGEHIIEEHSAYRIPL